MFEMLYDILPSGPLPRGPGVQNAPPRRILDSKHMNTRKLFKKLFLQNHLSEMLEIRYVALPSNLLPRLFKPRSQGSKWPHTRDSRLEHKQYIGKYEKNLLFQNHLALMLKFGIEHCIVELFKVCSNSDLRIPESCAALGFGSNS